MRIHLIPNSHIDPVWLWDKYEGIDEVLNTFRSACDRLDAFPHLTFTASSLQFYAWVHRFDRRLFDRIKQFVAVGRWEVVGGWWVESDTNLPSAASFFKHAEVAQAFSRRHFGIESSVAFLPDTFGHPATLPKILAQSGFKYLVFCRPSEEEKPDLPANLFHWEYQGHRILTYRLKHHYVQDDNDEESRRFRLKDEEYDRCRVNAFMFGVGNHGGGPSIEEIEWYNRYIDAQPAGHAGFSSCFRFFEEARRLVDIPSYAGDLHMHAVGCYAVLRDVKEGARKAEHYLAHAKRALLMSGETDAGLEQAWKTTLFNQFHDILPGSCSPSAAEQARAELGGVHNVCRDTAYRAMKSVSLARKTRAPQGEFRIFNTLPFPVRVPLNIESYVYFQPQAAFRDVDGEEIRIQEVLPSVRCSNRRWDFVDALPPQGYKSYYFDEKTPVERPDAACGHFTTGNAIRQENRRVGPEGTFLDAAIHGLAAFHLPAIRYLVLEDGSDTWGHGVDSWSTVEGDFSLASSSVLSGPVTSKLYQQWVYGSSLLDVTYSLFRGLLGVYVDLSVHWGEKRRILKVELGSNIPLSDRLVMQGAGGPIERRTDGKELPLHHWIWLDAGAEGLAVFQDGAFACDCTPARLRITFVRSSLYGYDRKSELNPVDPQQHTDQGLHRLRLWLLPLCAPEPDMLNRLADAFLEPYLVVRESG